MKKIIYKRVDGGVSVLTPNRKDIVGKVNPFVLGMSDEEYLQWIIAKDVPSGSTDIRIVDGSFNFPERSKRDKWVISSGGLSIDNSIETDNEKIEKKNKRFTDEIKSLGVSSESADFISKGRK